MGFYGVDEVRTGANGTWEFVTDIADPTDWYYVFQSVRTQQQKNLAAKHPFEFINSNRNPRSLSFLHY